MEKLLTTPLIVLGARATGGGASHIGTAAGRTLVGFIGGCDGRPNSMNAFEAPITSPTRSPDTCDCTTIFSNPRRADKMIYKRKEKR